MNFTNTLIKGKLVKRYKRFFADIEVNNKIVTAHCPNTGSMKGLLDEGNEVWISPQNDPSRKLKYTLELIKVKKKLVGVNTHRANRIVQHGLENKLISEFKNTKNIRPEFINSIKKGYKPYVLFLTQIQGINNFRIAKEIDPKYFEGYIEARKAGVKFLAYRCTLNSKQIKIEKKIIEYITKRIERSYGKILDFIYKVDQFSLINKKPIDYKSIKIILEE